jgi:hypothetical protein
VIAHKIGDFQARLILSLFYYAVLGPFALGVKMFSDPLSLRASSRGTWLPRPASNGDPLGVARRQY